MKKTLLALVVASAATSVNAAEIYKTDDSAIEFYGQLRTELKFKDEDDHKADLSSGSSRMGIDGSHALSSSVDVLGKVEVGIRDNSDVNVRLHEFGFAGDFGTIKFGKQWTHSEDIYGADYSYFFGGSAFAYDALNGALHDSQIKYTYEADSFWIKGGWGLDENKSNIALYELFAGTSFGDLSLHAGGGLNTDYDYQESGLEIDNQYLEFTAEYNIGDHLVGFTYYRGELSNGNGPEEITRNGFALAGIAQITDKTALYGGYEYTDYEAAKFAAGNASEDFSLFYAGVEHKFNSWARVYAEADYEDGTTLGYTNSASDSSIDAGVRDGEVNFAVGARFYW
ncbi:porin [Vibrio sp. WXL210]|uniref:porin n=1 Tax=Vibrio sp. WXL210 TaxID=3450709 RepID=UPI003EC706E1